MSKEPEFIVICQSAWMNESGFGIDYHWDGQRFANSAEAIAHGWELRESDDFNIGRTIGECLVWFGWMNSDMKEDEDTVHGIAEAIGLKFSVRKYRAAREWSARK